MNNNEKIISIIKAERFFAKSGSQTKQAYEILDPNIAKPFSHNQSVFRYIPGDPKDTFDIILN